MPALSASGVERLKRLLRRCTRAGRQDDDIRSASADTLVVDWEPLRDVKTLVKTATAEGGGPAQRCAELVRDLLWCVLRCENAKSRYRALVVVNALLLRCKAFRAAACGPRLRELAKLVVSVPGVSALPGPANASALLHRTAVKLLFSWDEHFGSTLPALRLTVRYLRTALGDGAGGEPKDRGPKSGDDDGDDGDRDGERERRARSLLLAQFETVSNEMSAAEARVAEVRASLLEVQEASAILEKRFVEVRKAAKTSEDGGGVYSDDGSDDSSDDGFEIDWSGVVFDAADADDETGGAPEAAVSSADVAEWESLEIDEREEKQRRKAKAKVEAKAKADSNKTLADAGPSRADITRDAAAAPVVAALRDAVAALRRTQLPTLRRWVRVLSAVAPSESAARSHRAALLREALELKQTALAALNRAGDDWGVRDAAPRPRGAGDLWNVLEEGGVAAFVEDAAFCKEFAAAKRRKRPRASAAATTSSTSSSPGKQQKETEKERSRPMQNSMQRKGRPAVSDPFAPKTKPKRRRK